MLKPLLISTGVKILHLFMLYLQVMHNYKNILRLCGNGLICIIMVIKNKQFLGSIYLLIKYFRNQRKDIKMKILGLIPVVILLIKHIYKQDIIPLWLELKMLICLLKLNIMYNIKKGKYKLPLEKFKFKFLCIFYYINFN